MTSLVLNPLPEGVGDKPAESPIVTMVKKLIDSGADFAALTKTYLGLRDKKKELDTAAKLKVAPLTEGMELIEAHFLAKFTELGVDNVKTPNGTPYVSVSNSVTMADADIYVRFVLREALNGLPLPDATRSAIIDKMMDSGALALLEARPAKAAVEQYLETNQKLPPGVNTRSERKLNVRK